MNLAGIKGKIDYGMAKAAKYIGDNYSQYRPIDPMNFPASSIASVKAAMTVHSSSGYNFMKPSDYKNPMFHVITDADLHVGDYLIGPATFFIASRNSLVPILAVQCNRRIRVLDREQSNAVGARPYGGEGNGHETELSGMYPVSLLKGSRGLRDQELPGDVGFGMFEVLMPDVVPLRPSLIFWDDLDQRYIVQTAEKTDLGWRVMVQQAVT